MRVFHRFGHRPKHGICQVYCLRSTEHRTLTTYYGKSPTDEDLRETIRSIVQEELAAAPVQLGDLLQALKTATPAKIPLSPPTQDDEPDEDDLDDALDSFGC